MPPGWRVFIVLNTVNGNVEPVEKVHFGIRKILEALYEQNTKNNSISNGRNIKS